MALTGYYVYARREGRGGKCPTLQFSMGNEEREKEKRNARYANTEHQAFGFACYRCHTVVNVCVEAGKSTQVCLKCRWEHLQRKVRVCARLQIRALAQRDRLIAKHCRCRPTICHHLHLERALDPFSIPFY
jgi:hypothetical protein